MRTVFDVNSTQMKRRAATGCAILGASFAMLACHDAPITRNGPPQRRIVSRVYPMPLNDLRQTVLDRYAATHARSSDAFRTHVINKQPPPGFSSDWLGTYTDPGGFLEPYRSLPDSVRTNDLVLSDFIGDTYWPSEYEAAGTPVKFRCDFVLHLTARSPRETEVQVFEIVPTVWVGEHWAMAKEGIGPAKVHDIRFVEPTVRDRVAVLDLIQSILK